MQRYFAEALGTFALVFAGTGAIVANDLSGGAVTHVGVALSFGLVVAAMIHAVGDVSGAHLNPAVSFGFWLARRLPAAELARYVLAQCTGAAVASAAVRGIFGAHATLGATLPAAGVGQCFALEVVITGLLMFTILGVASRAKEKDFAASFAVGGVVTLAALFAGPISGASMNPARSLAPALLSGQWAALWIYLTAPTLGAALAVGACRCSREETCCTAQAVA